jgi:hypothetical protein
LWSGGSWVVKSSGLITSVDPGGSNSEEGVQSVLILINHVKFSQNSPRE